MKVVVKNITQKVFEIELEASSTVRDVKNRLNEQHAIGSPELLKLIFQGKVLGDDETLNGTVNYSEDKFMVVMVSKPKAPAAAPSAASPAASAVSAPAPDVAQSAPSAAAAVAPAPAPVPAAAPAAPAVSSAVQLQIDQICEMGFERSQVELCMRAAFNNADRAVEYCMSGIPANVQASMSQSLPQRAAPAPGQPQRAPAPAAPRESAPGSVPNPFADGDEQDDGAGYDDMGGQPQSLAQALQNPAILGQFLAQMGQTNPEMVQQLLANPGMLQQFIENLQGGEGGDDEEGGDFGGMEEQGQHVELTPAEDATVRRMTDLGFPFQRALEAFLLCDRNEEMAVNYLLEHQGDDQ